MTKPVAVTFLDHVLAVGEICSCWHLEALVLRLLAGCEDVFREEGAHGDTGRVGSVEADRLTGYREPSEENATNFDVSVIQWRLMRDPLATEADQVFIAILLDDVMECDRRTSYLCDNSTNGEAAHCLRHSSPRQASADGSDEVRRVFVREDGRSAILCPRSELAGAMQRVPKQVQVLMVVA